MSPPSPTTPATNTTDSTVLPVELEPLHPGRKPCYTRRYTEVSETCGTLSVSKMVWGVALGLVVASLGCLSGFFLQSGIAAWALLGMFLFSTCFAAAWVRRIPPTIFFDKAQGKVWTARGFVQSLNWGGEPLPLADIEALQVVKNWIGSTPHDGHFNFQLNLVLHDGTRRYLVGHKRHRLVYKDGKALARFISVPFWDYSAK